MAEKKGVANVTRRTWDREHYAKLAQMRANGELVEEDEPKKVIKSDKQEFKPAAEGAAGPAGSARAFLEARSQRLGFDHDAGKIKVVKADEANKSGGYYCEVCERTLKDSVAYLDHINGKRHLQKLGFSMRVERSSVDTVEDRLQQALKRKYDPVITKKLDAMEDYERKIKEAREEEERIKRQKKEAKKARKEATSKSSTDEKDGSTTNDNDNNNDATTTNASGDADAAPNDADAAMMAMMGFSGFGSSKR
ncbi:TPA: hypothetical protein N0F65_010198 [Lagenidium giganteum]|uniref:C2H2-type domain-containing protein n=1 Tax=Lagenidium giganteum TaxID=4803 RepID=A0AAV2YK87_9STRA|nr:TPA: hypothetical protein N0F65_010198 [Lagenidium giganteum]